MKQILAVMALMTLIGCVSQPQREAGTRGPTLETWVQQELTPYLTQTIVNHPRLKNQTFAVVRMSGGDIQARIDGLTLELRRRITDSLAATSGVRLAWLPSVELRHHRKLLSADCGNPLRASYFIGIDVEAISASRRRIRVRLFDAAEGAWVSGKSMTWQGPIRRDQRLASRQIREDELLRGLRILPFSSGQPDLAAAYFANNLSCLLRQRGLSESRIHVEQSNSGPAELNSVLSLLDNYLSRLHQARITDNPRDAQYVIHPELHRIDKHLYQLWISLRPQGTGEHVAGLDTAAYVRFNPADRVRSARREAPTAAPAKPRISELKILHPARPGLCDTRNPWRMGRLPLDSGEEVSSSDCFLVRARAEHSDHLFLMFHTPDGRLERITPGSCGGTRIDDIGLAASTLYPRHEQPLRIADSAGVGTLYAVAVADDYVAERLQRHLQRLPDGCAPAADGLGAALADWTRQLDRLLALRPQSLDWTVRRLHFFE